MSIPPILTGVRNDHIHPTESEFMYNLMGYFQFK